MSDSMPEAKPRQAASSKREEIPIQHIRDARVGEQLAAFQNSKPLTNRRRAVADIFSRTLQRKSRNQLGDERNESIQCEKICRNILTVILAMNLALAD